MMVLLTGIPTSDGPEKKRVQAATLESEQCFMWDSFANRELISAHLSVMPEVLPPSELSSGMNRNVVEATSWKWGKTIGWVGFFEVASWFLALAPSRTAVWASDPDCVQLSINRASAFQSSAVYKREKMVSSCLLIWRLERWSLLGRWQR